MRFLTGGAMLNSRKSKVILGIILILIFAFVLKAHRINHPIVFKHKGKDFYIKQTKIDTVFNEVSVVTKSGITLPLLHDDGTSEPFKTEISDPADVKVERIIPNSEREQIILYDRGMNQAPEVLNEFVAYKVYFVEPNGVRKVADVTTYNRVSGFFDHTTISGSVTPKLEKGLAILEFRYVEEDGQERTKLYRWNGKVFVEDK